MLNTLIMQARLGSDPEIRYTRNSNTAVVSMNVACDRDMKTADGERKTDWITIVAYGNQAEFINKYFKKGDAILIQGRLQSRNYEDNNGNKRTAFEVLVNTVNFCGSKNSAEKPKTGTFVEMDEADDDLPF